MDMLQGAGRARTRRADQKIDLTKLNVVDRRVCFNDRKMNTFILKLEQQDDDNDEVRIVICLSVSDGGFSNLICGWEDRIDE